MGIREAAPMFFNLHCEKHEINSFVNKLLKGRKRPICNFDMVLHISKVS